MSAEEAKVYLATYSNTDVYESMINESPLMRRCKDDWVNATQILKCCNFPKAKRTKILEKGVQQGLHQKIQGGYGRFQGTWIPLADAQQLAANYGVTPEMAPVLFFDPHNPGFDLQKKAKEVNKDGTPVKRKYIKKKKLEGSTPKKLKLDDSQNSFQDFNPNDSFNSVSRMPSHLSSMGNSQSFPMGSFNQSEYTNGSLNSYTQQPPAMTADYQAYQMQLQMQMQMQQSQLQQPQQPQPSVQPAQQQSSYQYGYPTQQQPVQQQPQHIPTQQPPQPIAHPQIMGQFHHSKLPSSQSTNDTNWSQDEHKESDTSMSSNEEVKNKSKESYSSHLLKFFSEENASIPYFIHNPPFDFNINEAIDDEGHTPLHWASSIGNYPMIHLLITKGANPLVVNNYGLNPLSRLISFNNCHELKNFPKVLDDLEICLINTDINGRTPLHYLCQFSKVTSKYDSLRYYLGVILNKLTSLTNTNSSTNLLKNVLDHQDVNGDTCLHLAAKAGSSKIVKFLLSYSARDDMYNVSQETAKYLIMKGDLLKESSVESTESIPQNIVAVNTDLPPPQQVSTRPMSTPTRSKAHTLETPDTQRTTVQDDDDDDDNRNSARVDKEHINQLLKSTADDDKENIFLDSVKPFESVSTPIQASKGSFLTSSLSQQPLAVISERTAESTPLVDRRHESVASKSEDTTEAYHIQPPKLSEDGSVVKSTTDTEAIMLPVGDVNKILKNMIGSLTGTYGSTMTKLTEEEYKIKEKISNNETSNETIIGKAIVDLSKVGIEEFNSLTEAKELLGDFNDMETTIFESKEAVLVNGLEQVQAFQLANLVSSNEENLNDEHGHDDNEDNKINLAIELTNLQIKRSTLLTELVKKIKFYGIDEKMYKYRKLISLSCGLHIDEIDSLIDGIEESLMEANAGRV